MSERDWIERGQPFLEAVDRWYQALPAVRMQDLFLSPARVAVLCVDLTVGSVASGALAGPQVRAIVPAIISLLQSAYSLGVRYFLLLQDAHPPTAQEFAALPSHSVTGTPEAETVPEVRELPFAHLFQVWPKNSLNAFLETPLGEWVDVHSGVNIYIVVGAGTDLGVYHLAMHLRLQANARNLTRHVIVPANCVATYHREATTPTGAFPHEGELLHRLFLYHMALNGVRVVKEMV